MMRTRKNGRRVSRSETVRKRTAGLLQAIRCPVAERLESRRLLTTVIAVDPPENAVAAALSTPVSVTFDQDLTAATPESFVLHGSLSRGMLGATDTSVTSAGAVVTNQPLNNFQAGELIRATVTAGVTTTGGAATPKVWQFFTASASGSGEFADSGQVLTSGHGNRSDLADVDQDGDIDVLGDNILFNDGSGVFTDSGQTLGSGEFVDVDGDGDLDVVRDNVFLNDGNGIFAATGQSLGGGNQGFGDLDGDGDIDVVKGVAYGAKRIWLNNGSGVFTDTGQGLGTVTSLGIEVGDLDSDGDLDIFSANFGGPNRVWLNDGSAGFADSGQTLGGFSASRRATSGDIDNDGDIDVIVADDYGTGGPVIWLNDGAAVFTSPGSFDAGTAARSATLGDLDADGDLDAVIGSLDGSRIWANDGEGNFSGGTFLTWGGFKRSRDVDLGDIDGDGDLDLFTANYTAAGARLFINQNLEPTLSMSVDNLVIAEADGVATVSATLSEAHTRPVTIDLDVGGTATETDDFTISANQIVIPAGDTTGSVTVTAADDPVDESDETVIIDVANVTNAQGGGSLSITIVDDDEPLVPDVTLSVDHDGIDEDGGIATFSATLTEPTTADVTIDLTLSGTATRDSDYLASGSQIVIAAGNTSGSMTITAIDDQENEADETVIVDITSVVGGNEVGTQQQTTTIRDDDAPPTFRVTSLTETDSGFVVDFSTDLDPSTLNLYDTQTLGLGSSDATLVGAASGPVRGSLIVDDSLRSVTFIKAGGPLEPDSYTVTLRSGSDGFQAADGQLLDGNGDGSGGDNYLGNFDRAELAAGTVTLSIPDFTRGPGQEVNLPADTTAGIPVTISGGDTIRAVDLRIGYNPSKLRITGATVGADAPPGATVIANTSTPGLAIIVFFSSAALPAGTSTLINLEATVPTENAAEVYATQQILDLHAATVSDGNDVEAPVQVDDAVQLVSYFSDVSGNRRVNAADASQVARFAALIDGGFAGSVLTDPILAGDVSGNGRINAADASLVAQFAALIPVPQIPPIPAALAANRTLANLAPELTRPRDHDLPLQQVESNAPEVVSAESVFGHSAIDRVVAAWPETSEAAESEPIELEEAIEALTSMAQVGA